MAQFEKIPDLEKIFNKHKITPAAQKELKNAFEKMIIQTFYKELSAKPKISKPRNAIIEDDEDREGKCKGKCYPGTAKEKWCPNKATISDYCKRHDPNKASATKTKSKKKHEHDCHGIIKKTKKPCSNAGTVQPDGAEFHYCKRHSEKWRDFEEAEKVSDDED